MASAMDTDDQRVDKILEILPQMERDCAAAVVADNPGAAAAAAGGDTYDLIVKAMEAMSATASWGAGAEDVAEGLSKEEEEEKKGEKGKRKEEEEEEEEKEKEEEEQRKKEVAKASSTVASLVVPPLGKIDGTFRVFRHHPDRRFVAEDSTTLHARNAECVYLRMAMQGAATFSSRRWENLPQIESIDYVWNETLEQRFEMKKMQMLLEGHPAEELLLFHGTRGENFIKKKEKEKPSCLRFAAQIKYLYSKC